MVTRNLTDINNEWARKKALNNTKRLSDFSYDDRLEAPTPEQNERAQYQAQSLLSKGFWDGEMNIAFMELFMQ